MTKEATLVLVGGLIGLITALTSGFLAYVYQWHMMKAQWKREEAWRKEERQYQLIRDAQNLNVELHKPQPLIISGGKLGATGSNRIESAYEVHQLDEANRFQEPDTLPGLVTELPTVNLAEFNLPKASLPGFFLPRVNLRGANLPEANLRGANLRATNLSEANLEKANLQEADLQEANLMGANLKGAILERAILNKANLKGANLEEADLTNTMLLEAIYNADTIWPRGFDPEQIEWMRTVKE